MRPTCFFDSIAKTRNRGEKKESEKRRYCEPEKVDTGKGLCCLHGDKGESKLQNSYYEWQQGPVGLHGEGSQASLFLNIKQFQYCNGKRMECSLIILKVD